MDHVQIKVDFFEGHELFASLYAFKNKSLHKGLHLGNHWVKEVRASLSNHTLELIEKTELHDSTLNLLLLACPEKKSVETFLKWMEGISIGELYEHLTTWTLEGRKEIQNIDMWRINMVELLSLWNTEYFQKINQSIVDHLSETAIKKNNLVEKMKPIDFIEEITNGLRMELLDQHEKICLIPQYHISPYTLTSEYNGLSIIYFATEKKILDTETPSLSILNTAKALMDENRLKILRFLTTGEKSFTEIVPFIGLAKSTVHYHMVTLRSAGLVRVHVYRQGKERYSLRDGAFNQFNANLSNYLGIKM